MLDWGAVSKRRRPPLPEDNDSEPDILKRRRKKGVRWATDKTPPLSLVQSMTRMSPLLLFRLLPKWTLWLGALLFFRSYFFNKNANLILASLRQRLRQEITRQQI